MKRKLLVVITALACALGAFVAVADAPASACAMHLQSRSAPCAK